MRAPAISLEELAPLPVVYRAVIPPAYEDRNGHMNVRWYLALYDEAGDAMYPMLGLTADYFATSGMGGFDLEHHLWYAAEVRIGDTVVIRPRFLARSAKLLHYVMFMVNETQGVVSSIFECVHAHADLSVRRTAPFPAAVAARIDECIAAHQALSWPAPVSGSMGVQSRSAGTAPLAT
jgi:acyl-CoA thioester hydrolase